ncbi:MAG: hypothetical protein NZZ41_03905 [Candidatus Dojkabacteria bacterium]|nr:hypothetical protein [Candidatus Dojkabacteria bacterium]
MVLVPLKIFSNKKTQTGRFFPHEICEKIISQINNETIFIVNRVGITEEVDMSRAVGFLKQGKAKFDSSMQIVAEAEFFDKDIALAQPYDSLKYPSILLKKQAGHAVNAVKELAIAGGIDFFPVGRGNHNAKFEVLEYKLLYIHTQPKE